MKRKLPDPPAPAIAHFKAPRPSVKPRRIARPQVFAPGAAFVVGEPAQEIPLVTVAHNSSTSSGASRRRPMGYRSRKSCRSRSRHRVPQRLCPTRHLRRHMGGSSAEERGGGKERVNTVGFRGGAG